MIPSLRYNAPHGGKGGILLVMLPGAGMQAGDFAARGMVAALHERGLPVDVVAARPELELYLDGASSAALHRDIIAPARTQGSTRLWLLGISLGGMGALLYANAYPEQVEGLVLLAPFLGTKGTVAELAKAGGLAAWSAAQSAAVDHEKTMLVWLQEFLRVRPSLPKLYLGYGRSDRFSPGHEMLAAALPASQCVTAPGGHDWETWLALWRAVLDKSPFEPVSACE